MRFTKLLAVVTVVLLLVAALPSFALHEEEIDGDSILTFAGVWARATVTATAMGDGGMAEATPAAEGMEMGGLDVSAAYTTITNTGDEPLRLVAASSPVAGIVEIHEMIMENDVMQMRPIEGLDVPAGGSAVLEQGGYHIMLLDLQEALVEGTAIPLTLLFDAVNEDGSLHGMPFEVILAAPVLSEPPATDFAFSRTWARPTMSEMTMEMATPEATAEMGGMGDMHASVDVSAAYMQITNNSGADDVLVAASSPAAGLVEIHEMIMENDIMQMRPIEGGIPIAAGATASLEPGGLHIMLMELQMPLVEGTAIPITLTFASGAELTIAVPVIDRLLMAME